MWLTAARGVSPREEDGEACRRYVDGDASDHRHVLHSRLPTYREVGKSSARNGCRIVHVASVKYSLLSQGFCQNFKVRRSEDFPFSHNYEDIRAIDRELRAVREGDTASQVS